ncbi:hypothetical protein EDC44_1245 [Cricetibacter osteomyelitidis]|uniref:YcgL domain-containing protein EDC44_1245 n=1 Tax=Cricetibacter osteomyelitidis TaxID=1521931 RepID=A0A4R2SSP6_9PAST|nr:YcgL domain-containing protein [Cricetibacter osteomyelitidis]TCP92205.1 hypothetical protein EDC44_1245 [Cricetibacter osteomyelitidis]
MLCAIYRSKRKAGMYLYIEKRNQFDAVPESLLQVFGQPQFVMLFNLLGTKSLVQADNQEVLQHIRQNGFYLQMPKQEENLLAQWKIQNRNLS